MMKRIALLIALIPGVAFAGKEYDAETKINHDCASEPVVEVNAASADATFTGTCESIELNGAGLKVKIQASKRIEVNGTSSDVTIVAVDKLEVNGMGNTVTYKKAVTPKKKPKVEVNGLQNKVSQAK